MCSTSRAAAYILNSSVMNQDKAGINPCVAINNQDDDRHGSLEKAQKTMSNFICVEAANEELDWSCT